MPDNQVVFRCSWKSLSYAVVLVALELFAGFLLVVGILAAFAGNGSFIPILLACVFGVYPPLYRWRVKIVVDDSNVHIGAIIGSGRTISRDRIAGILQYSGYPGGVAFFDRNYRNLGSTPPMWTRRQLDELSKLLQVPFDDKSGVSWKK